MKLQLQEKQLETWLNRHRGLLLKVARSFASESHSCDDLFQEIAFQLWKSIPRYPDAVAESTWIYRVALYTAISWSRKETTRQSKKSELIHEPAVDVERKHDPRVEWLYERIALLDPIDRSLSLLMLDGHSYREISETLGMTESNVGVRIHRIKKQLTDQYQREKNSEL